MASGELLQWHAADGLMPAQVFIPRTPTAEPRRPLLVFLHGGGDVGFPQMSGQSLPHLLQSNETFRQNFPFIGLFPCSTCSTPERGWVPGNLARVSMLIARLIKEHHADPHRVVLTGQTMGGAGVWRYAAANPHIFSALVPVSASLNPTRGLIEASCCPEGPSAGCCPPVWVFHVAKDAAVPVRYAEDTVRMLKDQSGDRQVRYTRLSSSGVPQHTSCYEYAYRETQLYDWLLQQRCATCHGPGHTFNRTRHSPTHPPHPPPYASQRNGAHRFDMAQPHSMPIVRTGHEEDSAF